MGNWVLQPVGTTEKKKIRERREWVVRHADGSETRQPARPSSGGRMRQKGDSAVAKQRRKQLAADLAAARRDRIERAANGEFAPRSSTGEAVERLDLNPSPTVVPKVACDFEVPGARRRPETVEKADERRASYRSILEQGVYVNGRIRNDDAGANVLANDVRPL